MSESDDAVCAGHTGYLCFWLFGWRIAAFSECWWSKSNVVRGMDASGKLDGDRQALPKMVPPKPAPLMDYQMQHIKFTTLSPNSSRSP